MRTCSYLETLGELGWVGLGLLGAALATLLLGVLRRIRRPNRTLYAAVCAVFLAWALHAGVDWDMEMPVVTFPALALAAVAVAAHPRRGHAERAPLPDGVRLVFAAGWLAVAVTPALVTISDGQIARAVAGGESALGSALAGFGA